MFKSFITLLFLIAVFNVSNVSAEHAENPKFVIFSPPKNGTFISGKTLSLITEMTAAYYLTDWHKSNLEVVELVQKEYKNGRFVVSHHFNDVMLETLTKLGYKIIFIVRDPRDQLVSVVNWLREGQWGWMPVSKMTNIDQQIEELIYGNLYGQRCVDIYYLSYERRVKRIPSKSIFTIRFENLVGEEGGGSREKQQEEVLNLATFLNISLTDYEIDSIAANVYGGTTTFRTGQIGTWPDYFTERNKNLFKTLYNSHLIRLGYEKSSDW
jgi:Sulfotransferase domain